MQPRRKRRQKGKIMKREDIKAIFAEATDEQLNKVMGLHGADIEKYKGKVTALEAENAEKKTAFDNLNAEFEKLKESNASAEDYKTKLEDLKKDIAEKEKAAKEEKEKAEREANILSRYNAVAVSKDGKPLEWTHEAIKADYLHKFTEALNDSANEGKSDADIFHELIKDDGAAIKVPGAQTIYGGASNVGGGNITKEAFAKMGYKERVKLYNENKELYNTLNGGNE